MENNTNNSGLPSLPSGEELEEQKALSESYAYDLSGNWLDMSQNYPSPRFLLEYKGVPFSPLGGIQAITGQKKNGKTFLMCQLMAAILGTGSENLEAKLPGLRLRKKILEEVGAPKVLYIDTEMEVENTARVARRVHWLCGWNLNEGNDRFRVLRLRSEKSTQDRWNKIQQAILEVRPTAIFLDGIRDVIGDFNDNAASADLIAQCMSLATEMNCCFWCVLHENPGSDKMRGHLGTELGNKCTDTFVSIKKKDATGVTFTVKQVDARGKDVDDWKFEVTDDAGGLGIPRIINDVESAAPVVSSDGTMELKQLCEVLKEICQPPKSVCYSVLRDGLKKNLNIGTTKAGAIIRQGFDEGILKEVGKKIIFSESREKEIQSGLPF